MNPKVKTVKPMPGYELDVKFSNGERRVLDMKPYLSVGVFQQLRDPVRFQSVRVVAGSIEWNGEIDLSYDSVYLDSRPWAARSAA